MNAHSFRSQGETFAVFVVVGLSLIATTRADDKYRSADEAFRIGAAFHNARNYAASRAPLEAALKLAPDDKFRLKTYQALLPAYRGLPEIDKFLEAADFILSHSPSAPERSLMRRDLLSFVYQRGKMDVLVKKYEDALKKDPNDVTALFVLSEVYVRLKQDPKRSAELLERLTKVTATQDKPADVRATAKLAEQYVKLGKPQEGAELFEKIAPLDANLAAWHWKEAAKAWLAAKQKDRAKAAAQAAVAAGPEKRSALLTHFWHRAIGEVFLDTGESALAVEHLQAAINSTNIDGYIKDCQKKLDLAKQQSANSGRK